MKKLLSIGLMAISGMLISQTTISGSITHSTGTRTYKMYVPTSYTPGTQVPIVLNLHGYGSNNTQQLSYGAFNAIADTANFLVLAPQGKNDGTGTPHWNANWATGVDDIGFINALLDTISAQYSINQNRIYSTGMSNGGFMSLTLAGQLSDRIAAVASVTGTMSVLQIPANTVTREIPIMQIHGTSDPTVNYNGDANFLSVDSVINYWVGHNNCNTTPVFTAVPNTNTTDGCTAEKYVYSNANGIEVVHYKIIGGAHTWPGAPVTIGVTNRDFNASIEIWKFFNKYEKPSFAQINSVEKVENWVTMLGGNPSDGLINFLSKNDESFDLLIYDLNGKLIVQKTKCKNSVSIDLSNYSTGTYLAKVVSNSNVQTLKLIKK